MSIKPLASERRETVFACPEGGQAVMSFPTPLTTETVSMLEELCTLVFRGLHRDAESRTKQEAAEIEYQSWFNV